MNNYHNSENMDSLVSCLLDRFPEYATPMNLSAALLLSDMPTNAPEYLKPGMIGFMCISPVDGSPVDISQISKSDTDVSKE